MGRTPKKTSKENRLRSCKLQVYLTQVERERLTRHMQKSGYRSLSGYARKRLISTRPVPLITPGALNALYQVGSELARSGNNLNQLARYVHQGKKAGWFNPKMLVRYNELMAEHVRLQQQLQDTIQQILKRT